ncbi:efflux RND transporter periplasmic adaptor subunit [Virgibacillus sp. YIM 98842]|uniref:efflux RND transporter periplasmic adaptor subunit n=1 Tax=Virgibacillus sp. YIM 98842 TaxID=2663533 RepID=UPI0013DC6DBC|nr:efflux RND transporter periplasmic adaptor subunit [Virgibacillus sp. YIM 98842]
MKKLLWSMAAIMVVVFLAACNEDNEETETEEEEERVVPVEIDEAEEGSLTAVNTVYGRTEPNQTTPVMAETPGEIDTLEVENGDSVEEDDLIATLDTPAGLQNIRADREGGITNLNFSEGDMVTNEEPFAVIADFKTLKITAGVTSKVLALFEKDDTVNITIDGQEIEGNITSVGNMPDDTGLYPVEAEVENDDDDFLPGMVAKIAVDETLVSDTIIVPTEAVMEESEETYVYVVVDGEAIRKTVTVQETQSEKTALEGDIEAGDQVVTAGQLTLTDGAQVNVTKGE